jgi:hypothetical protein
MVFQVTTLIYIIHFNQYLTNYSLAHLVDGLIEYLLQSDGDTCEGSGYPSAPLISVKKRYPLHCATFGGQNTFGSCVRKVGEYLHR